MERQDMFVIKTKNKSYSVPINELDKDLIYYNSCKVLKKDRNSVRSSSETSTDLSAKRTSEFDIYEYDGREQGDIFCDTCTCQE